MEGVVWCGPMWGQRHWWCKKAPAMDRVNELGDDAILVARDNAVYTGNTFVPIPPPKSKTDPSPGSKSWGAFTNLQELTAYIENQNPGLRNVYEVCMGSRPRRLGFDLERAVPEMSPEHFLAGILAHLLPFLEALCRRPFTTRDIYLLNASDATKISFHLVTDVVIQPDTLRAFYIALRQHPLGAGSSGVDTSVYGIDRCMRLACNTKFGSTRVLVPVNTLGAFTFAETPTTLSASLLAAHMWSIMPAHPIDIDLAVDVPAPAPRMPVKRPRADGPVEGHDLVARVLGETHCQPRPSRDGDRAQYDMAKGFERVCPTGETHMSNGFQVWSESGKLRYCCFASTCSGTVFTLGPVMPCASQPTIRQTDDVAWREWGSTDVPASLWAVPWTATGKKTPRPWVDAPLIKDVFRLQVHVFRGEEGSFGPVWLFSSHNPCPFCDRVHCDPFHPYKVKILQYASDPVLYAPCKDQGKRVCHGVITDDFDTLLTGVQTATTSDDRLDASLRLLIWARGDDDDARVFYTDEKHHRNGPYTYRGSATAVRYDTGGGFRLVCKSPGDSTKTFDVKPKGNLRARADIHFDFTV